MALNNHRDRANPFLTPIARRLPNTNPNTLSWLALLSALAGGLVIYAGGGKLLLLASVFILLNSYLDAIDGKVAKIFGKVTKKGDFLDHTLDRYADIFMLLGITFSVYCAPAIGVLALVGVLMTSYMGTQAQALGAGRDYGGILGRTERQIILILVPLIQYAMNSAGITHVGGFTAFEYAMILFAVAGNLTAVHRGVKAWGQLA